MPEQLALIIDPQTDTASQLFGGVAVAGRGTQQRTYYESLKYWAEFTVVWLYHNDTVNSDRTRQRYLDVILDCFAQGNTFADMPFKTDQQRFDRLATVLDAAPLKPWDMDARGANAYKVALENRTHVTGKRERRGKTGKLLQKSTKESKGLSPKSIANAIAVLSSFYKKAAAYPIYKGGIEAMLYERSNPFDSIARPKFKVMFARSAMTEDQVNRVLRAVPANTVQGAFHFAVLTSYAETGRRNTEIRNLRWGDLEPRDDGTVWMHWSGKHHTEGETHQISPIVYQAITDYLTAAGRLETIGDSDYVFVAPSDRAARLPGHAAWVPGQSPVSMSEVNRIFQMYLKQAGIKQHFVIHSFRHTVAKRLLESGAGIEAVKETLGHANIATTLIYTEEDEHKLPDAMSRYEDKIGIRSIMDDRRRKLV